MSFEGFPKDLFDFFTELNANNKRDWFMANKPRYEQSIAEPCLDFIAAMTDGLKTVSPHFLAIPKKQGGSMFRIYRDVRFSKDKRPYKTHAGLHFRHKNAKDAHAPGFYVHLEPGNVFVGVGIWKPHPDGLKQVRAAFHNFPGKWEAAINDKKLLKRFGGIRGESLTRPPKGYDADDPAIGHIKMKSFFLVCNMDDGAPLKANFTELVTKTWLEARPVAKFLTEAVGQDF